MLYETRQRTWVLEQFAIGMMSCLQPQRKRRPSEREKSNKIESSCSGFGFREIEGITC